MGKSIYEKDRERLLKLDSSLQSENLKELNLQGICFE